MGKYKFLFCTFIWAVLINANSQITGNYKLEKKVINPKNYELHFSDLGSEVINRYEYSVITKNGDTLDGKGRIKTDKDSGESYVKINGKKVFAKNTKSITVRTKYYHITGRTIKTRWFFKVKSNPLITCYSTFPVKVDYAITHIQRHDYDTLIYLYNNNEQSLEAIGEILSINDKAYKTFKESHKYVKRMNFSRKGGNISIITGGAGAAAMALGVTHLSVGMGTLVSIVGIIPFFASHQMARSNLVKYRTQAISEFMKSSNFFK